MVFSLRQLFTVYTNCTVMIKLYNQKIKFIKIFCCCLLDKRAVNEGVVSAGRDATCIAVPYCALLLEE